MKNHMVEKPDGSHGSFLQRKGPNYFGFILIAGILVAFNLLLRFAELLQCSYNILIIPLLLTLGVASHLTNTLKLSYLIHQLSSSVPPFFPFFFPPSLPPFLFFFLL